jgi:hypothetical protein
MSNYRIIAILPEGGEALIMLGRDLFELRHKARWWISEYKRVLGTSDFPIQQWTGKNWITIAYFGTKKRPLLSRAS